MWIKQLRLGQRGRAPLNFVVRLRMSRIREAQTNSNINMRLRLGAAVMLVVLILTAANRYMELGWFGRYGRLVSASANLLTLCYLMYAIRAWRN